MPLFSKKKKKSHEKNQCKVLHSPGLLRRAGARLAHPSVLSSGQALRRAPSPSLPPPPSLSLCLRALSPVSQEPRSAGRPVGLPTFPRVWSFHLRARLGVHGSRVPALTDRLLRWLVAACRRSCPSASPRFLLCGAGACLGMGRGRARCGDRGAASPGVRGARHGVGQGVEGRLPAGSQPVDKHPRHQRPLELGVRRGGSPVHAAVHGRGGRGRRRAVHAAQQAGVVEIGRGEHPLQGRVVPGLGQQLQSHRRLPLPLRPAGGSTRGGCRAGAATGPPARASMGRHSPARPDERRRLQTASPFPTPALPDPDGALRPSVPARGRPRPTVPGGAQLPPRTHMHTHTHARTRAAAPAKLINMAPRLDCSALTLMFSDRIRVAATVCNETENYGSGDNWTEPPARRGGRGPRTGLPQGRRETLGNPGKTVNPLLPGPGRAVGEPLPRRGPLTCGSGTRFSPACR